MKVTKAALKQIIKEEVEAVMAEKWNLRAPAQAKDISAKPGMAPGLDAKRREMIIKYLKNDHWEVCKQQQLEMSNPRGAGVSYYFELGCHEPYEPREDTIDLYANDPKMIAKLEKSLKGTP